MTAKQRREARLFTELCKKHGYTFRKIKAERDQRSMMFFNGPHSELKPMLNVILAVPEDSQLGQLMAREYAKPAKKGRKSAPRAAGG